MLHADTTCPLCSSACTGITSAGLYQYDCKRCHGVCVDRRLARFPTTVDNWFQLMAAARELNLRCDGGATISWDGERGRVQCTDVDGTRHEITTWPDDIAERVQRLLDALGRMTTYFGERIDLTADDFLLAYVASPEQLHPYLEHMESLGLLRTESRDLNHGVVVQLTAAGIDAYKGATAGPAVSVFISSPCSNLIDCRRELAAYLQKQGYLVRASDLYNTFDIAPTSGALDSCLHNIDRSDVVITIVDGLYGTLIEEGPFAGKSVTHAELLHAQKQGKRIYCFMRSQAFADWSQLKENPQAQVGWVERGNNDQRQRWVLFVAAVVSSSSDVICRWVDQFDSVVDLKPLVEERLKAFRRERV